MENVLPDAQARASALETDESCIVQAPAGSGKTELLTLRYLKLLSLANEPEEVLAITFTKKAASEMRDRIVSTLQWAVEVVAMNTELSKEFEKQRLNIAVSVLDRDKSLAWQLLKNPSRLRVQTIDSFCFYLASQLPILSRVGGSPVLSDDVSEVYEFAIQNTLEKLNQESELSQDIALLFGHLDNNVEKVEKLLLELLNKRDQWISHALLIQSEFDQAQDYLRENLVELVEESLLHLAESLAPFESSLVPLLRFSASNSKTKTPLTEEIELATELPEVSVETLAHWNFVANLLLTRDKKWRAQVNVNNGFPAGNTADATFNALCKQRKTEMGELLALLGENDKALEALDYIRKLPYPDINTKQWQLLGAIARVLIQLSGELLLSFAHFGIMDYAQAGAAARTALGTPESPTDLALTLDHRIQHILVDEFQDTSQLQLEILQQLTQGWQQGDGRTLFLVGDPMQSCYGFRNANVGIYLNVQEHGIGDVHLNSLKLQTNFRSQKKVVAWVNQIFSGAFPALPDSSRGAVPYAKSASINSAVDAFEIETTLVSHDGKGNDLAKEKEAELVVEHIQSLRTSDPDSSIAILVRSRSHLAQIIPRLKEAGISWQATDIDRLGTLPVIEDLLSLTRAVTNTTDRLAWFAVLRAPWCGLTSADLFAIAASLDKQSVWDGLRNYGEADCPQPFSLSNDGEQRLTPVVSVMRYAMAAARRLSLRQVIETSWTLLRGHDLVLSENELESASHFFELLDQYETNQCISDLIKFEEQVKQSFVSSSKTNQDSSSINVLTMHKAKGLEYDHVILPGLTRPPAHDDKPLLQWYERLNANGENKLFLAALTALGKDEDDLYTLIRSEQKAKSLYEDTRLLYIAVTRAKTSALLIGISSDKGKGEHSIPKASLLARIWPQLVDAGKLNRVIAVDSSTQVEHARTAERVSTTQIRRSEKPLLLLEREHSAIARYKTELDEAIEETSFPPEYDDRKASEIGTLIHRCLEIYSYLGSDAEFSKSLENQEKYWSLKLRDVIPDAAEREATLEQIKQTVMRTVSNNEFRWIFDTANQSARSELQITSPNQKNNIVDRTLIDAHGVRWLIDYKTGTPRQGQTEDAFIESMAERYREQLIGYQTLFLAMEKTPIKTALLLTGINRLIEL